jgi:hypothetical protein
LKLLSSRGLDAAARGKPAVARLGRCRRRATLPAAIAAEAVCLSNFGGWERCL